MNCRQWLVANGYNDIVATIDEIMAEYKQQGKRTRRDWWETLAGDSRGKPRRVAGREFPVLAAAQVRQYGRVFKGATRKRKKENAPPVVLTPRWPSTE